MRPFPQMGRFLKTVYVNVFLTVTRKIHRGPRGNLYGERSNRPLRQCLDQFGRTIDRGQIDLKYDLISISQMHIAIVPADTQCTLNPLSPHAKQQRYHFDRTEQHQEHRTRRKCLAFDEQPLRFHAQHIGQAP